MHLNLAQSESSYRGLINSTRSRLQSSTHITIALCGNRNAWEIMNRGLCIRTAPTNRELEIHEISNLPTIFIELIPIRTLDTRL